MAAAKANLFFACFCGFFYMKGVGASVLNPVTNCPEFVEEGENLRCVCRAPTQQTENSHRSWLEHSNESLLELQSVSRRDNGKNFICRMMWGGVPYETVYRLQVAYGPIDSKTKVLGPKIVITNGTQSVNLTCSAEEVNPEPIYIWLFEPCNHKTIRKECTFFPKPFPDDGKTITCKAVNSQTTIAAIANFNLSLQYPPTASPEINGHNATQIHKQGDVITCKVYGGKPLVAHVIFTCENPHHPDEEDVTGKSFISSNLTLNSSALDYFSETKCICHAVWAPDKEMYTKAVHISFAIRQPIEQAQMNAERALEETDPWQISVIVLIVLFIVLAIVIVIVIFLWRKSGRQLRGVTQQLNEMRRVNDLLLQQQQAVTNAATGGTGTATTDTSTATGGTGTATTDTGTATGGTCTATTDTGTATGGTGTATTDTGTATAGTDTATAATGTATDGTNIATPATETQQQHSQQQQPHVQQLQVRVQELEGRMQQIQAQMQEKQPMGLQPKQDIHQPKSQLKKKLFTDIKDFKESWSNRDEETQILAELFIPKMDTLGGKRDNWTGGGCVRPESECNQKLLDAGGGSERGNWLNTKKFNS